MVPGLARTHYVAYLHMSRIDVAVGDAVTTTTRLGLSGNTGGVAAHLHLHVATATNYCGAPVDPGCPTPAWVGGSVIPSGFVDAPGCQSSCRPVPILWVQPAAYGGEAYTGRSACGSPVDGVGSPTTGTSGVWPVSPPGGWSLTAGAGVDGSRLRKDELSREPHPAESSESEASDAT
jgi:hypothetical protein